MKYLSGILLLTAALAARTASAACEIPAPIVAVPDGTTATEAELLAVQNEIQTYVAAMDRYIACENEQLQTRGENAAAEFLYLISARIESARSEVDTIATRFNDEVRSFRAGRPAPASTPPASIPPAPTPPAANPPAAIPPR
jgi:hypothetical protein